jgi:hypothetical protein
MNPHEETARSHRVGNKCPPRHTQFPKGRSGNPSGKRKRERPNKSLLEVLDELLRQIVVVTVGDRQERMTRFESLALGLIVDAQKGKAGARKQLFDLLRAGTPNGNPALITMIGEPHKFSWTEEQEKLFQEFQAQVDEYKKSYETADHEEGKSADDSASDE